MARKDTPSLGAAVGTSPHVQSEASEGFWTRRQTAQIMRVSLDGLDRRIHDPVDPIPCLKLGRRFLFIPSEVIAYGRRQAQRALGQM
jgi:hypothetical protein